MKRLMLGAALAAGCTGLVLGGAAVAPAAAASPAAAGHVSRAAVEHMITSHVTMPLVRAHTSHSKGVRGVSNEPYPTISLNWSGYAATSTKPFTYVHTQFAQPAIKCTGNPSQYTSNWSGLDGYTNGTVEQDGTFAWCAGAKAMTPVYYAWYEMFPAGSVITFPVKPGDEISSSVKYTGGKFHLTIADLTSGKSYTKVASCSSCQRTSAEWIIERPANCNLKKNTCWIYELADFGTSTMKDNVAQIGSGKVTGINGFANNYPIWIVQPYKNGKGYKTLDTVGAVSSGNSFTAVWDRPGSTVPIQL